MLLHLRCLHSVHCADLHSSDELGKGEQYCLADHMQVSHLIKLVSLHSYLLASQICTLLLHPIALTILQVFQSVAKDVMLRLRETQQAGGGAPASSGGTRVKVDQQGSAKPSSSGCCS